MIYSIGRYPVHLIDVVRLANGARVTLRPVLPQDVGLQRRFFRGLSARSRYCRFMTRLDDLPEALAERFTCIDYRTHLALVAEVFEGRRGTMIGEARYVADEHDPSTCEFAIAIADAWQGSGIARALLELLEREAAALGFRRFVADALIANRTMLRLAQRAGYAVDINPGDRTLARLKSAWGRHRLSPPKPIPTKDTQPTYETETER